MLSSYYFSPQILPSMALKATKIGLVLGSHAVKWPQLAAADGVDILSLSNTGCSKERVGTYCEIKKKVGSRKRNAIDQANGESNFILLRGKKEVYKTLLLTIIVVVRSTDV
jgi:hypothetical protein